MKTAKPIQKGFGISRGIQLRQISLLHAEVIRAFDFGLAYHLLLHSDVFLRLMIFQLEPFDVVSGVHVERFYQLAALMGVYMCGEC